MSDSACIDNCLNCHKTCLKTAMNHCLTMGGEHVEAGHFRLMLDCAKICETSASFQLSGSQFSADVCSVCAEICTACANSCEDIGEMDECVAACRECAQSCTEMSSSVDISLNSIS
ncbi:MAG: four-helix bundle copper-binding protein [Moraxellaceae bacterium]|nr:MAG: four-helix bundle copper-binding protein [Moraxellaceae bacterium]